jgi:hypothetical protein
MIDAVAESPIRSNKPVEICRQVILRYFLLYFGSSNLKTSLTILIMFTKTPHAQFVALI